MAQALASSGLIFMIPIATDGSSFSPSCVCDLWAAIIINGGEYRDQELVVGSWPESQARGGPSPELTFIYHMAMEESRCEAVSPGTGICLLTLRIIYSFHTSCSTYSLVEQKDQEHL